MMRNIFTKNQKMAPVIMKDAPTKQSYAEEVRYSSDESSSSSESEADCDGSTKIPLHAQVTPHPSLPNALPESANAERLHTGLRGSRKEKRGRKML
jgi:hypothetical protein